MALDHKSKFFKSVNGEVKNKDVQTSILDCFCLDKQLMNGLFIVDSSFEAEI